MGVRQPWNHRQKPMAHTCETCGAKYLCSANHEANHKLLCAGCRRKG